MSEYGIPLMAHLMRRAGFGATRSELEAYVAKGYEATVEDLLHPERFPEPEDDDLLRRYLTYPVLEANHGVVGALWLYRMVHTKRPLQEKMALLWHGLFATGGSKVILGRSMSIQVKTFRRHSLGNFRTLLVELSKDPAMLYWLDNCQSHRDAPNENWGRELLELFSMGVGNYTEKDVYECTRAFTGWTFARPTLGAYSAPHTAFEFDPEDHDDGEKEFLGERGRFNGEDIIDIIVRQPATAGFIARHLYNFFVADEPQVPAWPIEPPRDPEAVRVLSEALVDSGYEIQPVLRTLFNSDFFKKARFAKVKSPVDMVVGVTRLVGGYDFPSDDIRADMWTPCIYMGQELLNPPSVEGWHTGEEWIDSGTLVERVNYASDRVSDTARPGIRLIIDRLREARERITPEELVDRCLDLIGPMDLPQAAKDGVLEFAAGGDDRILDISEGNEAFEEHVAGVLKLIVASREFQFA